MEEPPIVRFVCGQRELKGEDVAFAREEWCIGDCSWHLFSVCDGHGGAGAAEFIEKNLQNVLGPRLPKGAPPPWHTPEGKAWASEISKALAFAFVRLDEDFARLGCTSGTTVSVALLCGWLLSTANIGDSDAFIDIGVSIDEVTKCHKVHTNGSEQQRLLDWGATVDSLSQSMLGPPKEHEVGIGPLRAWPGGVAVSRSIGDFDCCTHVVPVPHIRQVVVPCTGARLLLASDGLWDFFTGPSACKIARKARLEKAPARLFRALMFQTDGVLLDDTTIMVVDILPRADLEFRDAVKEAKKARKKGLFSKFRKALNRIFFDEAAKGMEFYSDMDALVVFPHLASKGFSIFSSARNDAEDSQAAQKAKVMANISVKEYQLPHMLEERMVQIHKAAENPADIFDDEGDIDEYCDRCGGCVDEDTCRCLPAVNALVAA